MKTLRRVARVAKTSGTALAFVPGTVKLTLLFYIMLALEPPKAVELAAVPAITMGAVIIAAFSTAALHGARFRGWKDAARRVVFRESIKRYAWFAAPIASGYGISQVITKIAETAS